MVLLLLSLIILPLNLTSSQIQTCPPKTKAGYNYIIFVGKAGSGGDKKTYTWFEYGEKPFFLNKKTKVINLSTDGVFCLKVQNLKSCQTYYYRAVAKNYAGINYGQIKNIKTLCRNWIIF